MSNQPDPGKNDSGSQPSATDPQSTQTVMSRSKDKAKLPPPTSKRPQAVSGRVMAGLIGVALVALVLGAFLSQPITAGKQKILQLLGFGDGPQSAMQVSTGEDTTQYYTCGMHPWIILPQPGKCPICHMTLTPLDPAKFSGDVVIDPVVVQNIGVRIEPVVTGLLIKTIRTVGSVDYNEKLVRDINTKISGWIEKLYVNFIGDMVQEDDVLFDVYSPDLYAAQEEYLLALQSSSANSQTISQANRHAVDLVESARTRLSFFDITDQQIAEIQKHGKPAKTMAIRSPYKGVVISKHANEGMQITPGMLTYRIADLSKVWVMVTLYEYQLPYVKLGQEAVMTLPYVQNQAFHGKVVYIYPYLDNKTREVQVRLEFDNPDLQLKPGMFANVELRSEIGQNRVLAPRSAIIDTGERKVAFVSLGRGKFEPRNVIMGVETNDGQVEVIEGLEEGEMLVISGQFLIDSEAKLRAALVKMVKGNPASEQKVKAKDSGTSELTQLPAQLETKINQLLKRYLQVADTLANDSTEGVADAGKQIARLVDLLTSIQIESNPHFWHQHTEVNDIKTQAAQLASASDLDGARMAMALLSESVAKLIKATGVPLSFAQPVRQLHCPMYRSEQDGSTWLQATQGVRNPYLGSSMLECFSSDRELAMPVTGAAGVSQEKPASKNKQADEKQGAPSQLASPAQQEHTGHAMDAMSSSSGKAVLDSAHQKHIDQLVSSYLAIQTQLTHDQYPPADAQRVSLADDAQALLEGLGDVATPKQAEALEQLFQATQMQATNIKQFRQGFVDLSDAVIKLVAIWPPSQAATDQLYHVYCPMVKNDWLQSTQTIRNPFNTRMLDCGIIKSQIDLLPKEGE